MRTHGQMPTVDRGQRRLLVLAHDAQTAVHIGIRARGHAGVCRLARLAVFSRLAVCLVGRRQVSGGLSLGLALRLELLGDALSLETFPLFRDELVYAVDEFLPGPRVSLLSECSSRY